MNKLLIALLALFLFTGSAFAKDTVVVTPTDIEVCEKVPSEDCKTVHHDGYWEWRVWRFVWVRSWDEQVCTPTEETVCHMETQDVVSTYKTFTEDTKCHQTTPPAVTWSSYDAVTETLNWSAVGGDKVELRFGWIGSDYPFRVLLLNDGHEKVGLGTEIGYFTNHYELRTINGCKKGSWSYFN